MYKYKCVLPARDVLSTPCDCDDVISRCGGVILKAVHAISQILLLTGLLKTLCVKYCS